MKTAIIRSLFAAVSVPALLLACGGAPSSSTGASVAAESSKACKSSERPAACPGGGEASCSDGKWECAPLPSFCDPSQEPAACPGGGVPHCTLGQWACNALPTDQPTCLTLTCASGYECDQSSGTAQCVLVPAPSNGCDPSQEPAACPGGGSPSCNDDGTWSCAPLPMGCDPSQEPAACPGGGSPSCNSGTWACAPLPSCVPDGQPSQAGDGSDCCSGNYDSNTNNCGN